MKLPFRPPKTKKLQAATVRRAREADYIDEPNVKLSSAFVVVLIMHLVAVGGIYAFTAIKMHQPPAFEETDTAQPAPTAAVAPQVAAAPVATPAPALAPPRTYRVRSGDTIAVIAAANGVSAESIIDMNDLRSQGGIHVGETLKLPAEAAPAPEQALKPVATAHDSGVTYTVKSGDTPVSIARKLHVNYDDLMRLNKIEDAKKLKIGLKLKVPSKHPTA